MPDTIIARTVVDPTQTVIAGAEAVAVRVVEALRTSPVVDVDLKGLRGAPSSFFNVVLLAVADRFGAAAASDRVTFRFGSDSQRQVYARSLAAVVARHAGTPETR